jgi:hypothetical protein
MLGFGRSRRLAVWLAAACLALAASGARPPAAARAADTPATATTAATSADEPDAAALMRRVAAHYAADVAGVLAVRSHSQLIIKAPFFGRRIASDAWYVFVNGVVAASSATPDPRRPPLRDPYVARYLDDYAFRFAPCPACAPGTRAVAYESAARDVEHAHGTFVVDVARASIQSGSETPYKLPWPTKSGELDAVWDAAPAGWFPVRVSGEFVGNVGPFVGHASYTQTNSAFERYGSVADAVRALERLTGLAAAAGAQQP